MRAIQTTYTLEKDNKIDLSSRALQIKYKQLKTMGATTLFMFICRGFEKTFIKNLKSKNPSLFFFDLYKLCFYCKLKKNA